MVYLVCDCERFENRKEWKIIIENFPILSFTTWRCCCLLMSFPFSCCCSHSFHRQHITTAPADACWLTGLYLWALHHIYWNGDWATWMDISAVRPSWPSQKGCRLRRYHHFAFMFMHFSLLWNFFEMKWPYYTYAYENAYQIFPIHLFSLKFETGNELIEVLVFNCVSGVFSPFFCFFNVFILSTIICYQFRMCGFYYYFIFPFSRTVI